MRGSRRVTFMYTMEVVGHDAGFIVVSSRRLRQVGRPRPRARPRARSRARRMTEEWRSRRAETWYLEFESVSASSTWSRTGNHVGVRCVKRARRKQVGGTGRKRHADAMVRGRNLLWREDQAGVYEHFSSDPTGAQRGWKVECVAVAVAVAVPSTANKTEKRAGQET